MLKTLALFSLLLLISCDETSEGADIEEFGGKTKAGNEHIQGDSNDWIESVINDTVNIYITKGNTQCHDDGLTLAETAAYLSNADIHITESQCGIIEGISFASVCGGGTTDIYIHTIQTTDLSAAENVGFTKTSLLAKKNLTYSIIDCPPHRQKNNQRNLK